MLTFTYCLAPIAKALRAGVLKLNVPATPSEINAAAGTGNYASKHVSLMRKHYGFTIEEARNGRTVVSYTVVGVPANLDELMEYQGVRGVAKPAKAVKAAKTALPKHIVVRAAKTVAKPKRTDAVTKQFGSSGEVSSYGVDADWDSYEGVNLRDLVV